MINKVYHTEAFFMKHKHHIIPKHMGGTNDPSNLIELSIEEHAAEHLRLYEEYGKRQDLGAYYLLSSQIEEALRLNSIAGGKIQGKRNAENGHMKKIQKLANWSAAGKKGGTATMKSGKGAFGDPIERLKSCIKGGKVQGKKNSESGHLKKITHLSKRTKGKMWITNGTTNKMIEPSDQLPDGFRIGKVQKTNK
jgi:hypothetical protein